MRDCPHELATDFWRDWRGKFAVSFSSTMWTHIICPLKKTWNWKHQLGNTDYVLTIKQQNITDLFISFCLSFLQLDVISRQQRFCFITWHSSSTQNSIWLTVDKKFCSGRILQREGRQTNLVGQSFVSLQRRYQWESVGSRAWHVP